MKTRVALASVVLTLAAAPDQARASEQDSVFAWGQWSSPAVAPELAPSVREARSVVPAAVSNEGFPALPLFPAASATIAKPLADTPPVFVAPPPPPTVITPPPPAAGVAPGNSGNTPGNSGQLKGNSGFTPSAHPNPPAHGRKR